MLVNCELPSTAQLVRSTALAAASAVVLLLTVVLPAEYGVDPTGIGRLLGLTEMGEIKTRLAREAAEDAAAARGAKAAAAPTAAGQASVPPARPASDPTGPFPGRGRMA